MIIEFLSALCSVLTPCLCLSSVLGRRKAGEGCSHSEGGRRDKRWDGGDRDTTGRDGTGLNKRQAWRDGMSDGAGRRGTSRDGAQ